MEKACNQRPATYTESERPVWAWVHRDAETGIIRVHGQIEVDGTRVRMRQRGREIVVEAVGDEVRITSKHSGDTATMTLTRTRTADGRRRGVLGRTMGSPQTQGPEDDL